MMVRDPRGLLVAGVLALLNAGGCGGKAGNDEQATEGTLTDSASASEPTGGTGSGMCEEQSGAWTRSFPWQWRPQVEVAATTGTGGTGDGSTGGGTFGGSTGGTSGETTGGTTGAEHQLCPDHTQVDGCCCFGEDYSDGSHNIVCDVTWLCPGITLAEDSLFGSSCLEPVDCALAALIAGKPGAIGWVLFTGGEGGADGTALYLAGDGTAFRSSSSEHDLTCTIDPVAHVVLKPKEYFLGCTKKAELLDRFECLRGATAELLEECTSGSGCDGGF